MGAWVSWLCRLGRDSKAFIDSPAVSAAAGEALQADPVPSAGAVPAQALAYPIVDPGIARVDAKDILAANADMIARLKLAYGRDDATFERDILSLLLRYAGYVNVLPATPDNYFREPGGLFRMGLEIAFYALQGTDGQIFEGRSTISRREHVVPRWRLATFVAGLCGEIHRTLNHVTVCDRDGVEWPSYLQGLSSWLTVRNADRLFPHWVTQPQESRSSGVFVLPLIVDRTVVHYLASGNDIVVPHMMASISGMATYKEHNVLDDLVRRATAMVIDNNFGGRATVHGKPSLGTHLERYLVDAMRRLAASNADWKVNDLHSRAWYGSDGLYLVWPKAGKEMIDLLVGDHLPGIPKSPDTVLEILVDAGVLQPHSAARASWTIKVPHSETLFEAVKLCSPALFLQNYSGDATPLGILLAVNSSVSQVPTTGTSPRRELDGTHGEAADVPVSAPTVSSMTRPAGPGRGVAPRRPAVPTSAASQLPLVVPSALEIDSEDPGESELSEDHPATWCAPDPAAPPQDATPATVRGGRAKFALTPPLRLRAVVGGPVGNIVDDMNRENQRSCRTIPTGLFIPLAELERRRLVVTAAVRELADSAMLVRAPDGEWIHRFEFDGDEVPGVVMDPGYIRGWKVDDDTAAASDRVGSKHAGT